MDELTAAFAFVQAQLAVAHLLNDRHNQTQEALTTSEERPGFCALKIPSL